MDSELESTEQSDLNKESVVKTSDNPNFRDMEAAPGRKSMKKIIFVTVILIVLLSAGFFFRSQIKGLVSGGGVKSTPSPSASTPEPSPTPSPLVRSDWSFEILNGSGVTGAAKKLADEMQALGYPVIKVGNADRDNYSETQILIREDLSEKIDLVIADLKDTIKIASVAGQLKEGTASARIIIGKDSI
ncbi:hypothetical protein A2867_03645 [Candidatus Daviesbacteria bacterium RIFCSPHIGHO2_01_FULL_40_11]|uniref:LytR/CpsA/Psr regulator C-terminal domain-containing protein n=1 Tax=Candidatus Daviesbacteria bacterium RIFCSPHIGHO2_01_FULL_40_11 TaxID=1797762 RepID=A0A1F5JH58_9BACT|nr:MAG: hypothetical protein A2867_03645 [Candidatus Daviesbacteria bacterium RIFCSPHIGHO2_01_FULL_40_11]OGE62925.1 MAG: hypothetical protein A2964_01200 [Candidatus Daviesbacteria bacterium RIFCSPLOWO2_01_FULL_40_27]